MLVFRTVAVCVAFAATFALSACALIDEPRAEPTSSAPTPATKVRKTTTPTTATPTTPSLSPLEQPDEWEDPELLDHPGEDASTFEKLEYEITNQIWVAAGKRSAIEFSCDIDEAELEIPGEYEYECVATYKGIDVPYEVTTSSDDQSTTSYHETTFLPITKEKAVHELTRQALDPAEVSCEMDDVQLVAIDDPRALWCRVTNVRDETTSYYGEVSANGGVFFSPAE